MHKTDTVKTKYNKDSGAEAPIHKAKGATRSRPLEHKAIKRTRVRHLYSDTMHVQTLILRKQAVIKNFLLHHLIKHVLL